MKNIIVVIFAILFVISFSLAAVAANDVNDTDTIGEVTNEHTVESVDVLKSTDNQIDENNTILTSADGEKLGADEGSFKDLQDLIDGAEEGSTIYLDRDYDYKGTDTVEFSKSITIDGNGHYLDGQGKDRIFDIYQRFYRSQFSIVEVRNFQRILKQWVFFQMVCEPS